MLFPMRTTNRSLAQLRLHIAFVVCVLLPFSPSLGRAADAVADLASFSVFNNIDLADLAKGEPKTMHGPPMNGRYLSVQSCYVAPGSPAKQVAGLQEWDATKHRELKVFLHGDL